MSCGLFDLLPEDIYKVLWLYLDPEGLALVVQLNRSFKTRTKDDIYWKRQANMLLDFNTIITEKQAKDGLEEYEEEEDDDDDEAAISAGFRIIGASAAKRFFSLQASGELKPLTELVDKMKCCGYFNPQLLDKTDRISWKLVYSALEAFLNKNRQIKDSSDWHKLKAAKALNSIAACSDVEMTAAAIKALLTETMEFRSMERLGASIKQCDLSVSPFLWEHTVFVMVNYQHQAIVPFACKVKDPLPLIWLLERQFNPWNREKRVKGGLRESIHGYVHLLGLPLTLQTLLERYHAVDLIKDVKKIDGQLVKVIHSHGKASKKIKPTMLATCIHLLFECGARERIITDIVDIDIDDKNVEDAIIWTIKDQPAQFCIEPLQAIVNDNQKHPRGRLRAAWILKQLGFDITKLNLMKLNIPGFPRPWVGPPMKQEMREAILRQYGPGAEKGTDPALLLEAELVGPSQYEDYENVGTISENFEGLEIIGPISAGELHQQGGGTYNVYKIYIDPSEANLTHVPEGATVFCTAVICTCTFGPYAYISKNSGMLSKTGGSGALYIERRGDIENYTDGKVLPTFEEASAVLTKWAEKFGFELVPNDLRQTVFDGLNVYYFGSRDPLSVQDLLFYWQD